MLELKNSPVAIFSICCRQLFSTTIVQNKKQRSLLLRDDTQETLL